MMHRTGGGSRWVGDGRMASSELHDVVSTFDERSRKTRGCPTAYWRRFCYGAEGTLGANAVAGL